MPELVDLERAARLEGLIRLAWPQEDATYLFAHKRHQAYGKSGPLLSHSDIDLFEKALLVLSGRPGEEFSQGVVMELRQRLLKQAESWSREGYDLLQIEGLVVAERRRAHALQNCADELRQELARPSKEDVSESFRPSS